MMILTCQIANSNSRGLDDRLKQHLRIRAAQHGRSMEDEARDILRIALAEERAAPRDLGLAIRRRFAPFGGVELPHATRELVGEPPNFDP